MSDWIKHCKDYQKKHGCTYKHAMTKAKATYHKKSNVKKNGSGNISNNSSNDESGRQKRKEDSGQNWLDNLERRVKANEGEYGKPRMQKTLLKTKGKKDGRNIEFAPPLIGKVKAESENGKTLCEQKNKSFVKSHCRKKKNIRTTKKEEKK